MKQLALLLLCLVLPHYAFADDNKIEVKFEQLAELGDIKKPTNKIRNVKDAFNFIMADKIVRESISNYVKKGYINWKATAEKVEDKDGVWAVTISSKNQLPPFTCYYRFDSIGNDQRERPWTGCQYE